MPVYVKAHRRGKSVVKSYTRTASAKKFRKGSLVTAKPSGLLGLRHLANKKIKVLKAFNYRFASGNVKYLTIKYRDGKKIVTEDVKAEYFK